MLLVGAAPDGVGGSLLIDHGTIANHACRRALAKLFDLT